MLPRSKNEIIAKILAAAMSPINQTALMYRANLNYTQLRYYEQLLTERGLIDMRGRLWLITERGRNYLNNYLTMKELLGEVAAGID
jgi:predicted transcriptional regulator